MPYRARRPVQMQRRHFDLIAEAVRETPGYVEDLEAMAWSIARKLSGTNDNFDADRFVKACLPASSH